MFKGLSGLKKAVQGGFSTVAEHSSQFAEQVVGDPTNSKDYLKESIKKKVQGGVATVIGAGETLVDSDPNNTKEKVTDSVHKIKHYGALGEDYLGYSDPTKDLRKAVKEREKKAKKARKEKKKKTGKKEDLFDPENLAKYKKELEEKRKRLEEAERGANQEESEKENDTNEGGGEPKLRLDLAAPNSESDPSAHPTPVRTPLRSPAQTPKDNEDWKAFQNLTSGVDSLVKKTQEKENEFKAKNRKEVKVVDKTWKAEKQRKRKKQSQWVNLDSDGFEEFDGELDQVIASEDEDESEKSPSNQHSGEQEQAEVEVKPEVVEQEAEPVDVDDDDDLFNTDFVNAITSGDVKLAVIPDDPKYDDEDDPFNTSFADQVVQKQKEEQRKEESRLKFTGLSAVADVLAGKAQTIDKSAVEVTVRSKRRRANRINLIADEAQEVTALEDIDVDHRAETQVTEEPVVPNVQVDILLGDLDGTVPNRELLATTPSPCPVSPQAAGSNNTDDKVDVSEFETLDNSAHAGHLTSNVAILSGEFAKPVEEEEDEFDAAFDALAHESVTKYKLEELEKQFEDDDIFDTTCADKILQLASLTDKVEEEPEPEIVFEDPFDTSAYEHITAEVEEELEFESLANREADNFLQQPEDNSNKKNTHPDSSIFGSSGQAPDAPLPDEGWVAFEVKKKPPRPAAPPRAPKRPPPPPVLSVDPSSRPETPSVVVKAPSTESIKSWNCTTADNLIKKSEKAAAEALVEQEEEFDPFDTSNFQDEKEITNFEDPFDTSAVDGVIGIDNEEQTQPKELQKEEEEEESENEEEEVPDPFDVITCIQGKENLTEVPIKPAPQELEEADPFDTSFATEVLPNKGDPFDTSYVSGDPGKAELKALEEELLSDISSTKKEAEADPRVVGRARPKGSGTSGNLSAKSFDVDVEVEDDPFDTSIVDKVIPVRRAKKGSAGISIEDDDFDPATSFQKSKSPAPPIKEEEADPFVTSTLAGGQPVDQKKVVKVDSIDSDSFDPRAE